MSDTVQDESRTIRQTRFFPGVQPGEIYSAFLHGGKHSKMTGGAASCSPRPGGKFTAWDGYISGTNLDLIPEKVILQTWLTTDWPDSAAASLVRWTFQPEAGGTRVRLTHSRVPPSQADSYRQGWIDFYWTPMKRYFRRD